ncbi:MAG: tRNA1(Val) (adenine(37)-N6)-methyltransferase [Sphingobacterium composti]|uniref:tRNA1(Val) (adenine(37)-N6)-methyltransferase n=1 Tax=Sphingobacterium composti TaxID=363260 RepID=UPI00135B5BCC|nr:methyltransferase [Sphingobacterium composti Ten et al. 2007 non Yoo et al. 2007]
MKSVFRFKQFEVNQQGCAMKINTDGVLLGAMVDANNPSRILDIGTGTGVIALMLAQRYSEAQVDAVEIDEDAHKTSIENFQNSPFASRIKGDLGSFEEMNVLNKYDLIVSNPPFYTNSLHNPDSRKKLARHADLDFFDKLLVFAKEYLSEQGQLNLILPVELAEYVILKGEELDFWLSKSIVIKSFTNSEVIRKIITLKREKVEKTILEDFVIYQEKGVYSQSYRTVLKPFFLAF